MVSNENSLKAQNLQETIRFNLLQKQNITLNVISKYYFNQSIKNNFISKRNLKALGENSAFSHLNENAI